MGFLKHAIRAISHKVPQQTQGELTSLPRATIIVITNLSNKTSVSLLQELPHQKSGKPNTSQAHVWNSDISLESLHAASGTSSTIIATQFQYTRMFRRYFQ